MSENQQQPQLKDEIVDSFQTVTKQMEGAAGVLAQKLWAYYNNNRGYYYRNPEHYNEILTAYKEMCGFSAETTHSFSQLWNDDFHKSIEDLFGAHEAAIIKSRCAQIIGEPYARSYYRPSYRSQRAGDYLYPIITAIYDSFGFHCYGVDLAEIITNDYSYIPGATDRIVVALNSGDSQIEALVEEAIMGEGEIKLSNIIINAVIKSGHEAQVENLGKLLLAAQRQEGLRQAILEAVDYGSKQTHAYFIKLVIDNNLARFSAVIRAFATWSGLAYGNAKPAVIDKCMKLAYEHLSDETLLAKGLASQDTLEIYIALWACACHDISAAQLAAVDILEAEDKYRRLTGWYFIKNTAHELVSHQAAISHIGTRDLEELAWICSCLYTNSEATHYNWRWEDEKERTPYPNAIFPGDKETRKEQFTKLNEALEFIGNKSKAFEASVFPWTSIQLDQNHIARCMLGIAGYDLDSGMIGQLAEHLPRFEVILRRVFYINLVDSNIPSQRALLLKGLSDKSSTVKNDIISILSKTELETDDVAYLANTLSTTASGLRKAVITLLGKQKESIVEPYIEGLVNSKKDKQVLAGLELLGVYGQDNKQLVEKYQSSLDLLSNRPSLPHEIAVILEQFSESKTEAFTEENGYGLYDPCSACLDKNTWEGNRAAAVYDREELAKILSASDDLAKAAEAIAVVLDENKDLECEVVNFDNSKSKVLIRDCNHYLPEKPDKGENHVNGGITGYYLGDEILAAFDTVGMSTAMLAASIWHLQRVYLYNSSFTDLAIEIFQGLPYNVEPFEFYTTLTVNTNVVFNALRAILQERLHDVHTFAIDIWTSLVTLVPSDHYMSLWRTNSNNYHYSNDGMLGIGIISYWQGLSFRSIADDSQYAAYWSEAWRQYLVSEKEYFPTGQRYNLLRAYKLGLVNNDGLYHELLSGLNAKDNIFFYTSGKAVEKEIDENYPFFPKMLSTAIDRIVEVEQKRGELPTPLTKIAAGIVRFDGGAKHFAELLGALGKDNFHRGYVWRSNDTKKTTLSVLMKNCYPQPADTATSFGEAIKNAGINEKRLLQAVMYAPQWAGLAEEHTGIIGLSSAVWLFHAHINERFNAEKETKIALYSPISQQQFSDGAFDKDWFLDAYNTIGETYFNELYKNAKYITDSSSAHRRSQLYADAVLGRLELKQTKAEIESKRNQEKLRAIGLIPLDAANRLDGLERYEFIQKYLKESKQFGSQRRASEGKASLIALQNLALTTGFLDAERMGWFFEGEKMDTMRHLMEPTDIGGLEVWLEIDEGGSPSIAISKAGKPQKTVPKAFGKHELVLEIKDAVKSLRDQKSRARQSFEMAMVSRSPFSTKELLGLMNHPVLKATASSLVFICGDSSGLLQFEDSVLYLASLSGQRYALQEDSQVSIAHPFDLMERNCWSDYQRYMYTSQTIQPFKQVFRELYPVTDDEREAGTVSRRYAGHQVQPQKTIALLKTRGWTVDYDEGLQRVYHKENLIAKMYALADWFSPAEIEAPTLETIRFFERDTFNPVKFEDISPVIFSEAMRDIDLVVSIAHVGGVDPEASHSTIDMRIAIAKELLSLLSVTNVAFQTAHALIDGELGEYSVHMGSGVVHQSGIGMLAVLPVHSQQRGRIFLPFADDDPKTAEIMSKILLFAEDKKIKDPSILRQMGK
ncbi:MAG: DUF4132 domain-containing protein [Eubacteriaceae bacterium]|nr:DUF4132 domain-containing protein [Eubacteriaceae bacterium]